MTELPDLTTDAGWNAYRATGLEPTQVTNLGNDRADRDAFLHGAELLRIHGDTARPGNRVQPQQLQVVDVHGAGHKRNACLLPRRSSKSTSLIALALGRAARREEYRVGILTMTTGKAGRSRFRKDVVAPLERLYPDPETRPFKIVKTAGSEAIEFPNGGMVVWLSTMEDLRGEAYDWVILDEAGEPEPEKVTDVLAAALPTMDTRPGGQITVAGTAGRYRRGNLLWDWLEGDGGGVLRYCMPDHLTDEDTDTWEKVEPLILAAHPGIGTLTTLESVRENYETVKQRDRVEDFLREYGGIFGAAGSTAALMDPQRWKDSAAGYGEDGQRIVPIPPEGGFAVAWQVHPHGLYATVSGGWRVDGVGHIAILEKRRGTDWLAQYVWDLTQRYDNVHVAADLYFGPSGKEWEKLDRSEPRPRLNPAGMGDVATATSLIVDELENGRLVHYDQPSMNEAAANAVKRAIGVKGKWGMAARDDEDITALQAAALALRLADGIKENNAPLILLAS